MFLVMFIGRVLGSVYVGFGAVEGLGFRVWGLGFRVLGFGGWGLGVRVWGFRV